jgi:hypothetical protein
MSGRLTRWPESWVLENDATILKSLPSAAWRMAAGSPINPMGTSFVTRGTIGPLAATV